MEKTRDNSIDILRAIALTGLIIAHTNPPGWLFQLRGFDVPLMVFLSGVVFVKSSAYSHNNYPTYLWQRILRLLFPTWIFLLLFYCLALITGQNELITFSGVFGNFTLMTGWYVWIIRVFIIIAIIAPFVNKLVITSNRILLILIFASVLLFFEIFAPHFHGGFDVTYYLLMVIPYVVIFSSGIAEGQNIFFRKDKVIIGGACLLIYITMTIYYGIKAGHYVDTNVFKYPPKLYYTSFALFVIILLWECRHKIEWLVERIKVTRIVTFVGSHSLWIYFWHIPVVTTFGSSIPSFILRFLVAFSVAIVMAFLQVKVVETVSLRINSESVRKTLKTLFIG